MNRKITALLLLIILLLQLSSCGTDSPFRRNTGAQRGKKAKDKLTQIIETYILEREQMTNLFVLIDIRHEPLAIDLEFIEWLGENGVPFSIVFTKADKLGTQRQREHVEKYLAKLSEQWEELPPHFVTSSEKGMGRAELLGYIEQINESIK